MIKTDYGVFEGNAWEELLQLVLKKAYRDEHYQEMKASPGDFGIEGFTKKTGKAFQCYCPDKEYTQDELYEKIRDKITTDLNKLEKHEQELIARLGTTKIKEWIFVTPTISKNKILKHIENKKQEVIAKNLSLIDDNFTVLVHDADFYKTEIRAIETMDGKIPSFIESSVSNDYLQGNLNDYEKNIIRKNTIRCTIDNSTNKIKLEKLNNITRSNFLENSKHLKSIEKTAPEIFQKIMGVINQYESELEEDCLDWHGSPQELTKKVKNDLEVRLGEKKLIDSNDIHKISNEMISKWIAICPIDFYNE